MSRTARFLGFAGLLLAISGLNQGFAAEDYQSPNTEFGVPDVQGVWNFKTRTSLERPETYAGELEVDEAILAGARRLEMDAVAAEQ